MRPLHRIAAASALVLSTPPVVAANLLSNPDFAASLSMSGWHFQNVSEDGADEVCTGDSTCGSMHFSHDDCCATPASGSTSSQSSLFDQFGLTQCVTAIAPDTAYDMGAYVRVTTDIGLEPGLPAIGLSWYPNSDCSGQPLASGSAFIVGSARDWTRTGIANTIAPSAARAAKMFLIAGATGDAGSNVTMEFDAVFFGPSGTVPVELQSFDVEYCRA